MASKKHSSSVTAEEQRDKPWVLEAVASTPILFKMVANIDALAGVLGLPSRRLAAILSIEDSSQRIAALRIGLGGRFDQIKTDADDDLIGPAVNKVLETWNCESLAFPKFDSVLTHHDFTNKDSGTHDELREWLKPAIKLFDIFSVEELRLFYKQ